MDKSSMRGASGAGSIRTEQPGGASGAIVVTAAEDAEGVETVHVEPEERSPIEMGADGSITVHLSHAFRPPAKGQDIATGLTKIVLREMCAGDMIEMDRGEGGNAQMLHLAASLSGLPTSVLERMHFEDFALVHAIVNEKLGKFLRVSAKALSFLPG